MEGTEIKNKEAQKIAKKKTDFHRHLFIYVIVMAGLALINNLTDPRGDQWWLWPAVFKYG
ncbi:MAG TPA: 2TM domain-containing protein [Spirochaetes bacterium]|nr:2TM domain-containing protein [Spirochaetota bacterium]